MDNKIVNIPISLIRDLLDNKVYSKSDALMDILSMADENGEVHISERVLMKRWGWGNTRVRNFIDYLTQQSICKAPTKQSQSTQQSTSILINTGFIKSYQSTRQSSRKAPTKQSQSTQTIKTTDALRMILDAWNELSVYGIDPILNCGVSSKQKASLINLAKTYSVNDILQTIEKIKSSDFLQGDIGYGWKITFDWFLVDKNYKKVRSGMYNDIIKNAETNIGKVEQNGDMFLQPIPAIDKFDEFWELYPKKFNYIAANMEYEYLLKTTPALLEDDLITATRNYAESCRIQKTKEQYIANPDNWLKKSCWINYMPENYKKPEGDKQKNKFNQFQQNEYDFELLEKRLLDN